MDKRGTNFSFVPKKRLGQNFLIDSQLLNKIVFHAEILPTEIVLEIGPGFGALTQIIQAKAKRVIAIEKDPALAEFLQEKGCQTIVPAGFFNREKLIQRLSLKLAAYEAGIGVYGRCGIIITPKYGPRVNFGVVLTDAVGH